VGVPKLIVVCGPFGSGKTTLAHAIARQWGCPAICRDEIKEGMVHTTPGFTPAHGDPLTTRTFGLFFELLELLLRAETSLVAEAAFQGPLWLAGGLQRLAPLADVRIVECVVDAAVARDRAARRHAENAIRRASHVGIFVDPRRAQFESIALDVPRLLVDTSDGYAPGMQKILTFIDRQR
jgi:predicted kinase